jgi:NAD(P)-dependent dehydrogenase (short-subunit alcohol dehydrogenase family)
MDKRVAVVTGARRGIGLAATRALLAQGRRVVMVDREPIVACPSCSSRA